MLKRGIIIVAVILLIALLTYFNPSITSLGFLSFNKEKDEIVYAADILNVNILNAQIISQNEIKVLIENKESIKLRLFIKVEGDKGIDSYYDNGLLEAKSTKYLIITFNKDKTGNFIKKINIIPYLQLENKKIVYKFSETSIQINKQISAEEISQETSLDSQILTTSQQRESTYIYGNGLIASLDDQGNIQYYHKDNLGSIRAITDDTGSIIYSTSYDPFGNKFDETSYSSYTYTGKQQDNTGLYYYGARYYDANLGRFTQLDPILSADDSPYVYVKNNPLKFVDPTGMQAGQIIRPMTAEQLLLPTSTTEEVKTAFSRAFEPNQNPAERLGNLLVTLANYPPVALSLSFLEVGFAFTKSASVTTKALRQTMVAENAIKLGNEKMLKTIVNVESGTVKIVPPEMEHIDLVAEMLGVTREEIFRNPEIAKNLVGGYIGLEGETVKMLDLGGTGLTFGAKIPYDPTTIRKANEIFAGFVSGGDVPVAIERYTVRFPKK